MTDPLDIYRDAVREAFEKQERTTSVYDTAHYFGSIATARASSEKHRHLATVLRSLTEGMMIASHELISEHAAETTIDFVPINLAQSVSGLRHEVSEIRVMLQAIAARLRSLDGLLELSSHNSNQLHAILETLSPLRAAQQTAWLRLADTSFQFWDNERDSMYDDL